KNQESATLFKWPVSSGVMVIELGFPGMFVMSPARSPVPDSSTSIIVPGGTSPSNQHLAPSSISAEEQAEADCTYGAPPKVIHHIVQIIGIASVVVQP